MSDNPLLDFFTTADILNTPIERGGVLPLTRYPGRTEFDLSSGITGSLGRAVTAPARAYRGELDGNAMLDEGMNLAGWVTSGGAGNAMARAAAHGPQDYAISAYKALTDPGGRAIVGRIPEANMTFGLPEYGIYGNRAGTMSSSSMDYMMGRSRPQNDLPAMDGYERAVTSQMERGRRADLSPIDGGRSDAAWVGRFAEGLTPADGGSVTLDDAYRRYMEWASSRGLGVLTPDAFRSAMSDAGFTRQRIAGRDRLVGVSFPPESY